MSTCVCAVLVTLSTIWSDYKPSSESINRISNLSKCVFSSLWCCFLVLLEFLSWFPLRVPLNHNISVLPGFGALCLKTEKAETLALIFETFYWNMILTSLGRCVQSFKWFGALDCKLEQFLVWSLCWFYCSRVRRPATTVPVVRQGPSWWSDWTVAAVKLVPRSDHPGMWRLDLLSFLWWFLLWLFRLWSSMFLRPYYLFIVNRGKGFEFLDGKVWKLLLFVSSGRRHGPTVW